MSGFIRGFGDIARDTVDEFREELRVGPPARSSSAAPSTQALPSFEELVSGAGWPSASNYASSQRHSTTPLDESTGSPWPCVYRKLNSGRNDGEARRGLGVNE